MVNTVGPSQVPVEVLLVDDDDTVASLIEEYLESRNFSVQRASNGAEALEFLKARDYDVILSDINMPVMNGMVFFTELSGKVPRLRERFIFMTAAPDMKTESFMKNSRRPVILKPFTFSELLKEFNTITGQR